MGYIFDAMNRRDPRDDDRSPTVAGPPLPSLDELARLEPGRSDGPDMQLDTLTTQVADLTADLDAASEPAATESAVGPRADEPVSPPATPVGEPAERLDDRLVVLREPGSLMAEEYRSIRTQLLARCEHKRRLVHTITSATPQEGKTITSMNLGLSFAELRNRSTIVIEADLRLPTFSKLIDLADGPGMIQYLQKEADLGQIVRAIDGSRLHVIPAGGRCGAEAISLLSSARMVELLAELRQRYDHVIIDTPPVTELADAGILGALSDEVMLIVRMNRTPEPLVEQAIRILRGYHAPVAGVIATDQKRSRRQYGYRYGYRYGDYTKEAA